MAGSAPLSANAPPGLTQTTTPTSPNPPSDTNTCPSCGAGNESDACCDCNSSSSSYSSHPIRYATGEIRLVAQDLHSRGFGLPWGHTRSYSNLVTSPTAGMNGASWFVKEVPQLVNLSPGANPNQATIVAVGIVNDALWFDYQSGTTYQYTPRFFINSALYYDTTTVSGTPLLVLVNEQGQKYQFFDFNNASTPGQFYGFVDAAGRATTAAYGGNNEISAYNQSSSTTSSEYTYNYYTSGANTNRLETVALSVDGNNVRQMLYTYHDGSDAFGSAGDLKDATEQVPASGGGWTSLGTAYHRYYKAGDPGGFAHGLKFVLTPQGYANMVAAGITPEIATDSQLMGYAKHYFIYDSSQRVVNEVVNGGARNFSYAYTSLTTSTNYNVPVTKTVETQPDGNQNLVYTNFAGQVVLKVFKRVSDGALWYDYYTYDSWGKVLQHAESSAVASYTESPWAVTLNASSGLIHVYDYYSSSSSSSSSTAGWAPGYLQDEYVKQGSGGSLITLKSWQYTSRSASYLGGSIYIYPLSQETVYPIAGNTTTAYNTGYSYTWTGSSFQINQRTTTWPVVTSGQNGSGSATSISEALDAYGNVIWRLDERGYITGYTFDPGTGSMVERIDDWSTGTPSAPWTPLSGPHLNATTDITVDGYGRTTQTLGPAVNLDVGGASTNVRRANWTVYQDATNQVWTAGGYYNTGTTGYTLINPVSITIFDSDGKTTDEIQATRASTSGALSASDSYPQSTYVSWSRNLYGGSLGLTAQQQYFLIPSSGYGTLGTNYNQAGFAYDIMKRQVRSVSNGGTITRQVFHAMGWVLQVWVGTNDNGATDSDPTGGGATGNNMVEIQANQYDGNASGLDGTLTQTILYQDSNSANNRTTNYVYDFRDRRTTVNGPLNFYQVSTYDNLNRVTEVQQKNGSSGNLISQSATNYDSRGKVYQSIQYAVNPATGGVGNSLTSNSWYDPSGNVMKQAPAGSSMLIKTIYDGLSRATIRYTSYNTSETGYVYPPSVSGDTVFQQVETTYDNASNVTLQTTRDRFHNATGTGTLTTPSGSQPQARVSFVAFWPDPLGRAVYTADYGTNGGSALTPPTTAPTSSSTVLVTTIGYNNAGRPYQVTDAKGTVNQTSFDAAGRVTSRINNVTGGSGPDQNQETDYTYNADGRILTMTAKNSTTGDQTTQYAYGSTLTASDIASNDLLISTTYPDSGVVTSAYNRQGQVKQTTDQLGTVHAYVYDLLGRLSTDSVTHAASGVDTTVLQIAYAYEVRGMLSEVTSYNSATGGTVVNDVLLQYNTFAQLTGDYQNHSGTATTGSPGVQYAYASGSANTIRPTSMTYPSGRVLNYYYGSSTGADYLLSRIASLIDNDGTTHLADYTRVGVDRTVQVSSPQPGTELTYIMLSGGSIGDGGDQYTGWDRFSRVIDMPWIVTSSGTVLDRYQYGFDQANNRQYRANMVGGSLDEFYTYDGLYQLATFLRGTLNTLRTGLSSTVWEEDFTLDPTGNWTNYVSKVSGTTNLNQTRTENTVNEITNISRTTGTNWPTPGYDANGNMNSMPQPGALASSYAGVYDAWNRLVKLTSGGSTVATYAYDGQNRRVSKATSAATRHYYYSNQWQVLEEQVSTPAPGCPERQFVWGLRYTDDLVLRDRVTPQSSSSSCQSTNERFYVFQDYFQPTAIANTSGTVQERYAYNAFGSQIVMTGSFGSRSASIYDWDTGFGAYKYDTDTLLSQVRNRFYHPNLGAWMTRDPIEYQAGMNLYDYVMNAPNNLVDPYGYIALPVPTPGLDFQLVADAKNSAGPCGEVDWVITWRIVNASLLGSKRDGAIVQNITITWNYQSCAGSSCGMSDPTLGPYPQVTKGFHYWEAWATASSAIFPNNDHFQWVGTPKSCGSVTFSATAWFYPGFTGYTQSPWQQNNPGSIAKDLWLTTADPKLIGTGSCNHNLTIKWCCCDPHGTTASQKTMIVTQVPTQSATTKCMPGVTPPPKGPPTK